SRRVTAPTHALVESWIRERAAPGQVILLEGGWLDLGGVPATIRRVPVLRDVLEQGAESLRGCDLLVVPEPNFGHRTLQRLFFLERFQASGAFGGNLGFDYQVYAVPPQEGRCVGQRSRR